MIPTSEAHSFGICGFIGRHVARSGEFLNSERRWAVTAEILQSSENVRSEVRQLFVYVLHAARLQWRRTHSSGGARLLP